MSVALLDLKRQFEQVETDVRVQIDRVLKEQSFILGPIVQEFEAAVAKYAGVKHAVGLASGTDALLLALRALDLQPGDEVITTPFTFFATAGTIHNAGGRAVFVDIDPVTMNLDPAAVERAITPRTRAIVPVHLFGLMAQMQPLRETARRHGVFLLEDSAQSIGARQVVDGEWKATGQLGDATTFSFFPSKNLGGYGDGGMLVTDDDAYAERIRRLRTHGGVKMYHHDEVGFNSRLDTLQAAILLAKLPYLDRWSAARRENAAWYDARFAPLEEAGVLRRPLVPQGNESVYNQYTLRVRDRDGLRAHLQGQGIGCAVYYPVPLHLQPCFAYLGYGAGDFPESERAAAEVLSIPVYPELAPEERERVAEAIEAFYAAGA
ncbi:DegT/DnrJ/EryC1/StrS family aminotransferase [Longimicrobium sp.]|uniref:DegT/DnrJ/EryC1/StrS family aminotransferase n=1 Tax=Longimicrobium sp. TaxID=2029185 RepID=UPI003B3BBAF6